MIKSIIRTTKEGRYYIKTTDFFKQKDIIEFIEKYKHVEVKNGKLIKPKQR